MVHLNDHGAISQATRHLQVRWLSPVVLCYSWGLRQFSSRAWTISPISKGQRSSHSCRAGVGASGMALCVLLWWLWHDGRALTPWAPGGRGGQGQPWLLGCSWAEKVLEELKVWPKGLGVRKPILCSGARGRGCAGGSGILGRVCSHRISVVGRGSFYPSLGLFGDEFRLRAASFFPKSSFPFSLLPSFLFLLLSFKLIQPLHFSLLRKIIFNCLLLIKVMCVHYRKVQEGNECLPTIPSTIISNYYLYFLYIFMYLPHINEKNIL